jgi:hypothetical protein
MDDQAPVRIPIRLIPPDARVEDDDDYWPPIFSPGDDLATDWWLIQRPSVGETITAMEGTWIPRNKAAMEFLRWRRARGFPPGWCVGGIRVT